MEHVQIRVRTVLINLEGCRIEGEWSGINSICTLSTITSEPLNLRIYENNENNSIDLKWDPPEKLNNTTINEYIIKVSKYILTKKFKKIF